MPLTIAFAFPPCAPGVSATGDGAIVRARVRVPFLGREQQSGAGAETARSLSERLVLQRRLSSTAAQPSDHP
jgi:hypothetical protein